MPQFTGPSSGGSGERVCVACGTRYPSGTRFCPSDGQVLRDDSIVEESLVGQLVAGRYYVERRLGVGGMGVVYLAQHVLMSRLCALKVLRREYLDNADALGRFTRGAQNAGKIVHPNVATVFDFGEVEGESMYLAMEYVDGPALGTVIEAAGNLSLTQSIVIVAQVAEALKAAHDFGIVHRDLKPDNVMLQRTEAGDIVKVVDFGIARAIVEDSQRVTDSKSIIGTPAYMSPEQIRGTDVDERSDLYSLALLTCEMLTGRLPLSTSRSDVVMRFLERPKSLRELRPEVPWPASLQDVLDRALAVQAVDRQASVVQFGREFIAVCRAWRPEDVAAAVASLSGLGMSLSLVLPDDAITSIVTPAPQPAFAPRANRARVRRPILILAGTAVTAIAMLLAADYLRDRSGVTLAVGETLLPTSLDTMTAPDTNTVIIMAPAVDSMTDSVPETRRVSAPQRSRPAEPVVSRIEEAPRQDSTPPSQVDSDSSEVQPSPAATPPVPAVGSIQIGSRLGAMLTIDDDAPTVVRSLRTFTVAAKDSVRLRLRLDYCRDWDSVVAVRPGQIVRLGYRNPVCPPGE